VRQESNRWELLPGRIGTEALNDTMAEIWLTCEDTAKLMNISARTVLRMAKAEEIPSRRKRGASQRNGKPTIEYSTRLLPVELQYQAEKQNRDRAPDRDARATAEQHGGQLALWAPAGSNVEAIRRPVTPKHDEEIETALRAIAPLLELRRLPALKRFPAMICGKEVLSLGEAAIVLGEAAGVCARTIRDWADNLEKFGTSGLLRDARKDKGCAGFFARHAKAGIRAAYLYLECKQSFRFVHQAVCEAHSELDIPSDKLPSYETVRAWLSSAPPYLKTYAIKGRRAYEERMSPFVSREYHDVFSNQCWVSDHALHDVEVMNDRFPEAPWGAPIRLRLTCLLDFRSRYVVGTSWSWEGSSRSIATAVRRAVRDCGPCEHFYCDNGKDYKKVAKGAMPAYLDESHQARADWYAEEMGSIEETGILARLQMKVSHCIVRHPQSKHVERFFRTMHEQFDRRWYQHYTGGAPHLRPDAASAEMAIHRKLIKRGRVEESNHPKASVFIAAAMAWIEEYHQRPHSGKGMDGRSPAEVFAQERNPRQRPAPELAELTLLLAERERRKVRECAVELNKRRYTYCDAVSRDILHERNETEVMVAYDPNDAEGVAILDEDGYFLCWARAEEMLRFAPEDEATQMQIAGSMADRRHLLKSTRAMVTDISRLARARGAQTPVEMLDVPAALPMAVNDSLTHRPRPNHKPSLIAAVPTPAQAAREFLEALHK
jgi:hypothetical protein